MDEWLWTCLAAQSKESVLSLNSTSKRQVEKWNHESAQWKIASSRYKKIVHFCPILDNKLHAKFCLSTKVAYHSRQLSNGTFSIEFWASNFFAEKLTFLSNFHSWFLFRCFIISNVDCIAQIYIIWIHLHSINPKLEFCRYRYCAIWVVNDCENKLENVKVNSP